MNICTWNAPVFHTL